jgi:signal transduction histidine kinase
MKAELSAAGASDPGLLPQARRISLLRLLLLAIATGIVVFFQASRDQYIPYVIDRLHLGLLLVAGIAAVLVVWVEQVRARWQMALHLVFDLVWIGLLVYYTGGVASPGVVLLFAVVLIGNLELPGVAPFSIPALAALVLSGNAAFYLAGWHPFPASYLERSPALVSSDRVLGFLAIQVAGLFLVDLLGQLLARRLIEIRFFTGVLIDQLAEGVLAVDLQGLVVYANAEFANLLALTQSPQGRMSALVLGPHPDILAMLRRDGFDERSDLVHGRYLVLRAQDVVGRRAKRIGRILVVADETRLRILEENARRAEQLAQLGGMAAGIAHEVRNPLTSLRGCAQELSDICARMGQADAAALARIMIDESDRLARIVGDFLAMSRLREPRRVPVALSPILQEMAELSRRRQDTPHGILIDLEAAPDCPEVFADPDQLRQVLSNLINNAIDAVIHAASPRVTCRAVGAAQPNAIDCPAVEITVSDNGCGIPPELQQRVFAPFFSTKAQGTGLGLSLVAQIVRQHDGVLRLQSVPDGGTVITILLPCQDLARAYDRIGATTALMAIRANELGARALNPLTPL